MRRMDRYNNDDNIQSRRADKNQELYQNISSNSKYTNITDVTNTNAFEINNSRQSNYRSREAYQQLKKYQSVEPVPRVKKELEDFNYLYQKNENKIYDINSVLEEARKNRQEKDVLEEKRRLKNTSYNILAGLNLEELEKYRGEKNERVRQPEEEEIRELIDTITSKTLAGEIDKATSVDLLSDLMATNVLDKVEKPNKTKEKEEEIDDKLSLSKEILDKEQIKEIEKKQEDTQENRGLAGADTDFYTRSMDLSDKDFEMCDEFKEKKLPVAVKVLIFILIVALITLAAYFIYKRIQ